IADPSTTPAAWTSGSESHGYQLMGMWPAAITGAFGGYSSSKPAKPASAVKENKPCQFEMDELLQCVANQAGSSEAPKQGKSNSSVPNVPARKISIDIGTI
uniref:Uncharacterized protein n=1 Tax=Aquila chrysaetos chrysaetos TaxID=223781 RepID=A0A663FDI0_AQUCH